MLSLYVLTFCRIVIGLVFALSATGKVRDRHAFEDGIAHFDMLPKSLTKPAVYLLLIGEIAVVALMVAGNDLLWLGFALATSLLLLFTVALVSVLIRGIRISCNCFGPSKKEVSPYEICRNSGFVSCALSGWGVSVMGPTSIASPSTHIWMLLGVAALVFVVVWTEIGEIVLLFRH